MTGTKEILNKQKSEYTKQDIFYLLKAAENPKTSLAQKEKISKILGDLGLTATYFPTVVEFKLNGILFAKKITHYSTKRHSFGFKKTITKFILI